MKKLMLITIFCLSFMTTRAESLRVVEVSAPDINCIFDPACRVVSTNLSAEIALPVSGKGFLQTRTFKGKQGAPAAGMYAYLYRVDLRRALGILNSPCVTSLTVNFGNVVKTLDFNGDGETGDEVFVITRGSLGSVGLNYAEKEGRNITFNFDANVCAEGRPNLEQSTFFFGLVARNSPRLVEAALKGLDTSYKSRLLAPKEKDPLADEFGQPGSVASPLKPFENRLADSLGLSTIQTYWDDNDREAVVRRLAPQPCVDRGGIVTIFGWNFGRQQGTQVVELGGHGIGILLRVRSWSDNRITALIPDNPRIQFGQWYYIGLQNKNRNWISNISRTINICRQLE